MGLECAVPAKTFPLKYAPAPKPEARPQVAKRSRQRGVIPLRAGLLRGLSSFEVNEYIEVPY
jgi:hypothetical protein